MARAERMGPGRMLRVPDLVGRDIQFNKEQLPDMGKILHDIGCNSLNMNLEDSTNVLLK